MSDIRNSKKVIPYVKILEQPASKGTRFRYECEGKFAGCILGDNSKTFRKTYPTVQIVNYRGPAFIVVSCVDKDPPYCPHPHNLVGKTKEVSNGICYFTTDTEDMIVNFNNLGIQCVKRKDIEKSLTDRQKLKVDPFNTGFSHIANPDSIDLYCIRLCFQVFLEGREKGKFTVPLNPVVSEQIHDKRIRVEPNINFLSHHSASVAGGTEMCILCEKATKDDIEVRFFRQENSWEAIAELTPPSVYKQVSIVFKSPKYIVQDLHEPVNAKIQLRRISDGETSESIPFQFLPLEFHKHGSVKRKRSRDVTVSKQIQAEAAKNADLISLAQTNNANSGLSNPWELPLLKKSYNLDRSTPLIIQKNNELNAIKDQSSVSIISADGLENYNVQNTPFNISREQAMRISQSNLTHQSTNLSQQLQQNQKSSDTLNSDSWVKELFETIEQSISSSQAARSNNLKNIIEIAPEPETNFIVVDSSTLDTFVREESNDVLSVNTRQTNNSEPRSSSGNLSSCLNISDLIKHCWSKEEDI